MYKNYKNKVSKYKNKLNQIGGACPYKNGDTVIRKDDNNKYGTVVGLILSERLQNCIKLRVKLANGEVEIWNSLDVQKLDTFSLNVNHLTNLAYILSNTNIFGIMLLPDLVNLYRFGNQEVRSSIKQYKMHDFYDQKPLQKDVSLREFNEMFPFCRGLNISHRTNITDADFVYLRGIKRLSMTYCNTITNNAFVNLRGIHTLDISNCTQITDDALVNLRGIHTLFMLLCRQITDAAFVNLRGIHTLAISYFNQITITDAAFINIRGIHTLDMDFCGQITITDAAFINLRGIQYLDMTNCRQNTITDNAFNNLHGIKELNMYSCNRDRIEYARSIGLPVTTIFR